MLDEMPKHRIVAELPRSVETTHTHQEFPQAEKPAVPERQTFTRNSVLENQE